MKCKCACVAGHHLLLGVSLDCVLTPFALVIGRAAVGPLPLHQWLYYMVLKAVKHGTALQTLLWCPSLLWLHLQVAIKKVLQDKRFKNRELQIMKMMDHCNVVQLKHCFYTTTEKDEVFLNLVLEFVPETVYRIGKHYSKNGQRMPTLFVKLYVYQVWSKSYMCRLMFICCEHVALKLCLSCRGACIIGVCVKCLPGSLCLRQAIQRRGATQYSSTTQHYQYSRSAF